MTVKAHPAIFGRPRHGSARAGGPREEAKALTFVRAFSSCLNYVSEGGLEPPFPAKGTSTSS